MASISANGSKGHHKFTLSVSETATNIANNNSTVFFSLKLSPVQTGWDWNISGISYKITINGTSYSGTIQSYDGSSSVTIKSGTQTVAHNSDGAKTMSYSFSITDSAGQSYTPGNASASGNLTLTKIARQATITSAPNFTDEENPTIKYSNPAGNTVSALDACISITGAVDDIPYRAISKTGNSYTFELTDEERTTLRQASTTSNSLTVIFHLRTKIGSSTFYSTSKKTLTIVNGNPVFSDFTYKDTNISVVNVIGNDQVMVKGLSTLQVTISSDNKMTAIKEATAKNYVNTIDSTNISIDYSEDDVVVDMGTISSSGIKRLNVRAYDSRNNSTLVYKDIIVYDYSKPIINATVSRLNNFENETTLKVNGSYSRLEIDGTDKNVVTTLQYRYREVDGEWTEWKLLTSQIANGGFTCDDVILSLDNKKAFEFEVQAIDNLDSDSMTLTLDVGEAIFFISSNQKKCYINGEEILQYNKLDETTIQYKDNMCVDSSSIVHDGTNLKNVLNQSDVVVDYTFENSTTNSVTFDVELLPNEIYDIRIIGGSTSNSDVKTIINDVATGYYLMGRYGSGSTDADSSIVQLYNYRHNKSSFYYAHCMRADHTIIEAQLSLDYSVSQKKYYPHYRWRTMVTFSGTQFDSDCHGWLNADCTSITKIKYELDSGYFKEGTRIVIKRRGD